MTDRRPTVPQRILGDIPTIEQIVAVDSPREFRLEPRGRLVAYTIDTAGARQLMTLPLRGGYPSQLTASEKPVSDPQWSPDSRRLAFVRDNAIWVIEVDGSRSVLVTEHPAGTSMPRWAPDGRSLAFVSRRRGWSQVWLVDAPVPRRGRPAARPRQPEARTLTLPGVDVDDYAWSPDGACLAIASQRSGDLTTAQIHVLDVATGVERLVAGEHEWATGPRWCPDGALLFLTDADGWFQVARLDPGLTERAIVTRGKREHGEPSGSFGFAPLPSPDGSLVVHAEVHDGLVDPVITSVATRRPTRAARELGSRSIAPWPGVWRAVDWLPDGSGVLAIGESERRPQDLWLLPVPVPAGDDARARRLTASLPAVLNPAFEGRAFVDAERIVVPARDGLRIEGSLRRPPAAIGRRGGRRVPAVVYPHGGPTWQAYRMWMPFKQVLVREGFAVLDVDFRGSTGYGRVFRQANHGEWGHADVHDVIDAGQWLREQPWCDGRIAIWGGSYGGYMVLSALVEEPSLWRAGVDLYGDSEIAESYRHGDRVGRIDLQRQMGSPDDSGSAEAYRRGSPVYRAERIEAPVLILHGRKDKRVVPLMSERMIEALEIEGKHHEIVWYDDEGHGWEKRETRRDAFTRTLAFLKRHVLDGEPDIRD